VLSFSCSSAILKSSNSLYYFILLFPFLKGSHSTNCSIELLVELSNKRQGTFYHEIRRRVKTINKKTPIASELMMQ